MLLKSSRLLDVAFDGEISVKTHHALAFPVVGPGLVITDDTALNVSTRCSRAWLVTIALATKFVACAFITEFFGHSAETALLVSALYRPRNAFKYLPEFGAAHIKWALLPWGFGVFSTFGMCIAIGPAFIVRALAVSTACFRSVITVASLLRAASSIAAWLRLRARKVIVSLALASI